MIRRLERANAWHPSLVGGGKPILAAVPFQAHGCDPEKHFRVAVRENELRVVRALIEARVVQDIGKALQSPSFDGNQVSEEMEELLLRYVHVPKSAVDE